MKKNTLTHKRLIDVYGELGVPEVGGTYRIDYGFKRIEHLIGVDEVVVLSITLTDVYIKNLSTGRRSNIAHQFFKQYQEAAIKTDLFYELHNKKKAQGSVVIAK